MDLAFNAAAPFTRWVVETGALHEPFVVVDVGVQGGEHPRWQLLGDHLVLHGLDPIVEAIETLRRDNAGKTNRHYHCLAAGSRDGSTDFYFNAANSYSSSIYPQGHDRFGQHATRLEQHRRIEIRRLDSLLTDGIIPRADFLKVDVEAFEPEVFAGADNLLQSVLGVESESTFDISPVVPKGHFVTIHEKVAGHGLLVFDINFNRIPRAAYQSELERKGLGPITDNESVGRPATLNVLFCRDLIAETDAPQNYAAPPAASPGLDPLIKAMIIYELHGLSDIALDTAVRFADRLGTRLDVSKALTLLADAHCRPPGYTTVASQLREALKERELLRAEVRQFKQSTSWRITAPLRAIRRCF